MGNETKHTGHMDKPTQDETSDHILSKAKQGEAFVKRSTNPLIADSDEYFKDNPDKRVRIITPVYSDIAPAFRAQGRKIIGCADEGVRDGISLDSMGVNGSYHFVHMIGSGIQTPDCLHELFKAFPGVYGITAHAGCAGAAAVAKQNGRDDTDAFAEEFAKEQAKKYGTRYLGIIPLAKMKRPAQFHDAVGVYLDGSGVLDQSKSQLLPDNCFTLNAAPFENNEQAMVDELKTLIGIAHGSHGLGFFSEEQPFYIFVVGKKFDTHLDITKLTKIAQNASETTPTVRIVGFETP